VSSCRLNLVTKFLCFVLTLLDPRSDNTFPISYNSKMRETEVNPEPIGSHATLAFVADDKFYTPVNKMTSKRRESNIY